MAIDMFDKFLNAKTQLNIPVVVPPLTGINKFNLTNAKIVFTGKLADMTRNEAASQAKAKWPHCQIANVVTGATNYVIAGDDVYNTKKIKDAQKKGVEIISDAEFKELLEN